jgi:glutaredoxin
MRNAAVIFIALAMLALCGCIGESGSNVSNEELEKILNGTDMKNVSVQIAMYYGDGCPHCENTLALLKALNGSYNITLDMMEVWHNEANRESMFALYASHGMGEDQAGVPTMLINGKMMVIGEISAKSWIKALNMCGSGRCPEGAYRESEIEALKQGRRYINDWKKSSIHGYVQSAGCSGNVGHFGIARVHRHGAGREQHCPESQREHGGILRHRVPALLKHDNRIE